MKPENRESVRTAYLDVDGLSESAQQRRAEIINCCGTHTALDPQGVTDENLVWSGCVPATIALVGISWLEGERNLFPVVTIDPTMTDPRLRDHMAILDRKTMRLTDMTPAAEVNGELQYVENKQDELVYNLASGPTVDIRTKALLVRYNEKHGTNFTFEQVRDAYFEAYEECRRLGLTRHIRAFDQRKKYDIN